MGVILHEIKKLAKRLVSDQGNLLEKEFTERLTTFTEFSSHQSIDDLGQITVLLCKLCPFIKSRALFCNQLLRKWRNILDKYSSQLRYTTFLTASSELEECAVLLIKLGSVSIQINILKILFAYLEDDKESIVSWMCLLFNGFLAKSNDVLDCLNSIDLNELGSFSHNHMLLHLVNKYSTNRTIFSMQVAEIRIPGRQMKKDLVSSGWIHLCFQHNTIEIFLENRQDKVFSIDANNVKIIEVYELSTGLVREMALVNLQLKKKLAFVLNHAEVDVFESDLSSLIAKMFPAAEYRVHKIIQRFSSTPSPPQSDEWKLNPTPDDENIPSSSSNTKKDQTFIVISKDLATQSDDLDQDFANQRQMSPVENNWHSIHQTDEDNDKVCSILAGAKRRRISNPTKNKPATSSRKRKPEQIQGIVKDIVQKPAPKHTETKVQSNIGLDVYEFDDYGFEPILKKKRRVSKKPVKRTKCWPKLPIVGKPTIEAFKPRYTLKVKVPVGPAALKINKKITENICKINEMHSPVNKAFSSLKQHTDNQVPSRTTDRIKKKPQPKKLFTESKSDFDGIDMDQANKMDKKAKNKRDAIEIMNTPEFDLNFNSTQTNLNDEISNSNVSYSYRLTTEEKDQSQNNSKEEPDSTVKSIVDFKDNMQVLAVSMTALANVDINHNFECKSRCFCSTNRKAMNGVQVLTKGYQSLLRSLELCVQNCTHHKSEDAEQKPLQCLEASI